MKQLLRAELDKIRSVRLAWGVALASLALTGLTLAQHVLNAGRAGTPSLGTGSSAVNILGAGGRTAFVALVLGVLVVTAEFRHNTIATTFLTTPRRHRVIVAKVLAAAVVALGLAVISLLLSVAVAAATGALPVALSTGAILTTVLGVCLAIPLYAVLGVGFATLVTNQTVAVAAVLLWFLVGETMLGSYGLRWLQRWTPGGATAAIAQDPSLLNALPPWAGVLVLLAYGVGFAALGTRRIARRDIA